MAEHIGVIQSASWQTKQSGEGKTFKVVLEKPKWTYYLFEPKDQTFAEKNVGEKVKVEYEPSEEGNFRNVKSIELYQNGDSSSSKGKETTNDMWAEKDRITRASIETQNAYTGVIRLMAAGVIKSSDPLGQAALSYAASKLSKWFSQGDIEDNKPQPSFEKPLTAAIEQAEKDIEDYFSKDPLHAAEVAQSKEPLPEAKITLIKD